MDRSLFVREINRLKEVYGPNSYPDARIAIFWEMFLGVPDDVFHRSITKLIAAKKTAPMSAEIIDAVNEIVDADRESRAMLPKPSSIEIKTTSCEECEGSGYAFRSDAKGYRYLYRCNCTSGDSRPAETGGMIIPKVDRAPKSFTPERQQ